MGISLDFYDRALARIRELREGNPDLAPMLSGHEEILLSQKETASSFAPDFGRVDFSLWRRRVEQGIPALIPEDAQPDWTLFERSFRRIAGACRKRDGTGDSPPTIPSGNAEWRSDVLAGALGDRSALDRAANQAGMDAEMFAFAVCQALAPFVEARAGKAREAVDWSDWAKGMCPVCGQEPLMAQLAKETGKRALECRLCRTQWDFKRLECPFCGNDDHETLRFFADPQETTCRVDVCDRCKRYLKTVDARLANREILLFVENLATLHLDLVAQREGFEGNAGGMG